MDGGLGRHRRDSRASRDRHGGGQSTIAAKELGGGVNRWFAVKLLTTLTGREEVADHAVFALLLKLVAQRRRRAKMCVRLVC